MSKSIEIEITATVPVTHKIHPQDLGERLAEAGSPEQCAFFRGMLDASKTFSWESQCWHIADYFGKDECGNIAEMLDTLSWMLKQKRDEIKVEGPIEKARL